VGEEDGGKNIDGKLKTVLWWKAIHKEGRARRWKEK
jgi:hypothetical protein